MTKRSKSAPNPPTPDPNWRYETAVAEVERIIQSIESGDMDLADVFAQFSQAVHHLNQCESFLTRQQQQMEVLIETLEEELDDF